MEENHDLGYPYARWVFRTLPEEKSKSFPINIQ